MFKSTPSPNPPGKPQTTNHSSSSQEPPPNYAEVELRLKALEEENTRLKALKEENTRLKEENTRLKEEKKQVVDSMRRYGVAWNGRSDVLASVHYAVHYKANAPNQLIESIPEMLWQKELCPLFNLQDLAFLRCTAPCFQLHWRAAIRRNRIRVPNDCDTVERAMILAILFSEKGPLRVELEKGEHNIEGCLSQHAGILKKTASVARSHITFVGKGKDQTTINGGFRVFNQQNVTFEQFTLTNPKGGGLYLRGSETNVDVLKCAVKECGHSGMYVHVGVTVTATDSEFMENPTGMFCYGANTKARLNDCTMHHNGEDGLWADDHAVVDLHGTKMDIHFNKGKGIYATDNAKVNIHLPSDHNTTHDNVGEDRVQDNGGSIANINANGTFTHVPQWTFTHVPMSDDESEEDEE